MIRPFAALVVIPAALAAGTVGHAETIFTARITHDQEVTQGPFLTSTGDPRPESFGMARFVLDDAMTALTFTADIFNIDVTGLQTADTFDDLVNAHIHAPGAPGSSAGVVWGFIGNPFNDTSPTDTVVSPFSTGVGGRVTSKWDLSEGQNTTLADQLPNIIAGLSYINFHTVQFAGGEIRGQIVPIPEPSTIALSGLGALAIAVTLRRRRRAD